MAESSSAGRRKELWSREAVGNEWRCWEKMDPEILTVIFTRIPADELSRIVPFVCRGWREVMLGPYCWSEVDIVEWCHRVCNTDVIDAAVRKLVRRSRYTIKRLSAYMIGNWGFSLAASFGSHLKVLEIPGSEVSDKFIEKYSENLKSLQVLDISTCHNITAKGIETIGKNCTSLIELRRNMYSPEFFGDHAIEIDEAEALAVAKTMPGLQKLHLPFGRFSDYGLDAILNNCKALSYLDLMECWNVKLTGSIGERCYALKFFRDPSYDPYEHCEIICSPLPDCSDDDSENY